RFRWAYTEPRKTLPEQGTAAPEATNGRSSMGKGILPKVWRSRVGLSLAAADWQRNWYRTPRPAPLPQSPSRASHIPEHQHAKFYRCREAERLRGGHTRKKTA